MQLRRALLEILVVFDLGPVFAGDRSSEDLLTKRLRLDPSCFQLGRIEVIISQANGTSAGDVELTCFNRELGFFYPNIGTGRKVSNGRTVIHLPKGSYTMIVSGPGFFVADNVSVAEGNRIHLAADQEMTITADTPTGRWFAGADVRVGESRLVPVGRATCVGQLQPGGITLQVNHAARLEILAVKRPVGGTSDGNACLLHLPDVTPARTVRIEADPRRLACIDFDMADTSGRKCLDAFLRVGIPAFSDSFYCDYSRNHDVRWNSLHLWFTPECICCTPLHLPPDGFVVEFYPTVVMGRAGQTYAVRAGGQLKSQVWFYPDNSPKEVWVEVRQADGGPGIRAANRPSAAEGASINFTDQQGARVFSEILDSNFSKSLSRDPTRLRYAVNVNLGQFGNVSSRRDAGKAIRRGPRGVEGPMWA